VSNDIPSSTTNASTATSTSNDDGGVFDDVAPVASVVLYEDRADLERVVRVALRQGQNRLTLRRHTPLAAASRTSALVRDAEGKSVDAYVSDLHVQHRWLRDDVTEVHADDRALQEKVEALQDERRRRDGDVSAAHKRLQRALRRRQQALAKWGVRAHSHDTEHAMSDFFAQAQAAVDDAQQRWHDADDALRAADEKLSDLMRHQPPTSSSLSLVAETELLVHADVDIDVELVLTQQVPCALWRPSHVMHVAPPDDGDRVEGLVADGDTSVHWTVTSTIWQHTLEDWDDVEVSCSTQRPSKGAQLPRLSEDWLTTRAKTAEEKRTIRVEHRQEQRASSTSNSDVPGVFDGGEVRLLQVPKRLSLRSDGRPRVVDITSFETPGTLTRVAFPDESASVFVQVAFKNVLPTPLLAGPVELSLQGSQVGTTQVAFIGSGERFSLGVVVDERLQVRCQRRRIVEERRLLKDRVHFVRELEVWSTSEQEERFQVQLRFPISEVEQLKVHPSMPHCTLGEPSLDDDGIYSFHLRVPAKGKRTESVGFHFEASGQVQVPDPW